jgi:Lecithin retinol acyltransferase
MSRGDHIFVRRRRRLGWYSHHGVDCGDGSVIHYAGDPGTVRRVERTTREAFAGGSAVLVRGHRRRLPPDEAVAKAESRLGSDGYHLVWNNCEHFATWSSTGSRASKQVRGWAMAGPGMVASLSATQEVGAHVVLLSGLGMGGAYALGRPLRRRRRRTTARAAGATGVRTSAPRR